MCYDNDGVILLEGATFANSLASSHSSLPSIPESAQLESRRGRQVRIVPRESRQRGEGRQRMTRGVEVVRCEELTGGNYTLL